MDLTWDDKKLVLEPQLTGTAETLKIELCKRIRDMEARGTYAEANKDMVRVTAPAVVCRVNGTELRLSDPALTAVRFEALLEPFLDTDHLYARETEYRLTQSIFSPLTDALDRAGLDAGEVDFCLLTGGSVLIPQVRRAIEDWFGKDKVGCYDDPELMQTAVARGAAWNTIYMAVTGKALIEPVLHDGIDLETNDGSRYRLIESDASLPCPDEEDEWLRLNLEVPRTGQLLIEQLRIKLLNGHDGHHLLNEVWDLPRPAAAGDGIVMEYRVTVGKQLECRAFLKNYPKEVFTRSIENPLVNVVNPCSTRLKIAETEEMLRRIKWNTGKKLEDYVNLAKWYAELNQLEKSLYYLRTALKKKGQPSAYISNFMGIYYEDLSDHERAEKAYLEAIRADRDWESPFFNLALLYSKTGRNDQALLTIDKALEKTDENGAYLSLKANIFNRMDKAEQARKTAVEALERFSPLKKQNEWELGWYLTNARFLKDDKAVSAAEAEKKRRKKESEDLPDDDTPKPVVKGNLVLFKRVDAA